MALMNLAFRSEQLKMTTDLTVIVPEQAGEGETSLAGRKVLWLLHGLSDNNLGWTRYTSIERYALDAGIVVVMPSAGRSMYWDGVLGQRYFSYIAEELPAYLGYLLRLSRERALNFVAGNSMGAFGAARLALGFPERYSALGLFSGLLDLSLLLPAATPEQMEEFPFLAAALDGGLEKFNPVYMLDRKRHENLPIFLSCGEEDDLFPMTENFCRRALEENIRLYTIYGAGGHEWRRWDDDVDRFIIEYMVKER